MEYNLLFLTGFIILAFVLFFRTRKKEKSRKVKCPGPSILEMLIGFVRMQKDVHLLLCKWAGKYGRIFCLTIWSKRFFFMNDADLVRQVFGQLETSWRPYIFVFDPFVSRVQGILSGNGKEGQIHRNFVLTALKSFGVGRPQMTETLTREVEEMISEIRVKSGKGEALCIQNLFLRPIINSLWLSIISKRFEENDPTMSAISLFLKTFESTVAYSTSMLFAQFLRPLWSFIPVYKRFKKVHTDLSEKMEKLVMDHRKTWIKDHPRDLVDTYFDKVDSTQDENSHFYQGRSLVQVLNDLVVAGTHTVTLTMEWAILQLVRNPQVQGKIQEELNRVLCESEAPSLEHRSKLPYTEATISEILRLHPVSTQGISHLVIEDMEINGLLIPKNSEILSNIFYIQNNQKVWGEDVEDFIPERWLCADVNSIPLDEDGDGAQKVNARHRNPLDFLLTFSAGRRKCPGSLIARELLFLLISNILHKFTVERVPGGPIPTLEPVSSFLLVPHKFSALFLPR